VHVCKTFPQTRLAFFRVDALFSHRMSVIESIVRGVQSLPLREQVEVARYVHRLSTSVQGERAAVLQRTHGALDGADGEAFEQAMHTSRRSGGA
jgi:hypothetical protein